MKKKSFNESQKQMLERVLENLRDENERLRNENERMQADIENLKTLNSNKSKPTKK